ncbi:hypothetical protein Tco_1282663 [Tanacetum coccineum]
MVAPPMNSIVTVGLNKGILSLHTCSFLLWSHSIESFSRVVIKSFIQVFNCGKLSISHLFYADDAMFIGEWSDENLKVKTLSIGGRLTLLKSVLGATPIYSMSIFKVPHGVLKVMESIRARFFNGADQLDNKIAWVAWDKVLASKKNGGLGVSSFFALNRALLLKWVWRFVSQDDSLWRQVICAIYGTSVETHRTHYSSNWCSILREVHKLKGKGFDFWSHVKKRIGNGADTRMVRGGIEQHMLVDLHTMLESVSLSNSNDRWVFDLVSDGSFRVKETRNFIDDTFLPAQEVATRWVNFVPIKVKSRYFGKSVLMFTNPGRFYGVFVSGGTYLRQVGIRFKIGSLVFSPGFQTG